MPEVDPRPATVISKLFTVEVRLATEIAASAATVWATMTDLPSYPDWSPFITRIEGSIVEGEQLTAVLTVRDRDPQHSRPRIVAVEPGRCFEWQGRFDQRGLLLDARHRFELRPTGDDACVFVHSERFNGVLVPYLRSVLTGPTAEAFLAHNLALKRRVEGG